MAMKSSSVMLVVLALVALMATSSKAQLPGIGGVTINLGVVTGIVNCSLNASSSAPPFPNATVQLRCGGIPIASTVTSSSGRFSITITLPRLLTILTSLFTSGGCSVVVTTPLASCNATLPATGTLVAPVVSTGVGFIGSILAFLFGILTFIFTP